MEIKNSQRLSYALMGSDDADLLFELDQDIEVMRYINGGEMTSMQDIHNVFLPRMAKYTDVDKGWGLWKVVVNTTDQFIGWILVRPMDFFNDQPQWDNWELGWRFKRESWGYGYGTEAAQHIMSALTESQELHKFSAIAMPENQASINIMKKLGMKHLKTELHKDPLGDMEAVYYELDVSRICHSKKT